MDRVYRRIDGRHGRRSNAANLNPRIDGPRRTETD